MGIHGENSLVFRSLKVNNGSDRVEQGTAAVKELHHCSVGCVVFILQKSVEDGEVRVTTHISPEDPTLGELGRGALEGPVSEEGVDGGTVDRVQHQVS